MPRRVRRLFVVLPAMTVLATLGVLLIPSAASAYVFDPPSWFEDGVALLKKRGGRCEPYKHTSLQPPYPYPPGSPQETRIEEGQDCFHRIPRRLATKFGQNPDRGEVCAGSAVEVTGSPGPGITPSRETYGYGCRIFANPGSNRRPNLASWPCDRYFSGGQGERERSINYRRWVAPRTGLYRKQRFKTLKQCLSRRSRLKR